jgi:hypothetical protein
VIPVRRELDAGPAAVWAVLVDTRAWPAWGPTVRGAELDDGDALIRPGCTGRVRTVAGIWLPFEVTDWEEGRRWAWKVGGVPATAHAVAEVPGAPARCRATIEVPSWAPVYTPVCWIALGRIGRLAGQG